jgi:hypothetical protein
MKNVAIIILYPFKIRNFDLDRYEIQQLKNFSYLEIHEFSHLLYPYFVNSHQSNYVKNKNIIPFFSVNSWKEQIFILRKKYKKILIFNFLINDNFLTLKIYSFLKKLKIKRMDILNPGLPYYSFEKKIFSLWENYFYKLKNLFFRYQYVKQNSKILIKKFILNLLIKSFDYFKSDFILKAGKKYLNMNNNSFTSVINGVSYDYSRYLRKSKLKKNINSLNYAVFLAAPGPNNPNDSLFWKTKMAGKSVDYYNSLNNFLSDLERIFKTKIVIALHPKSPPRKKIKELGSRYSYSNKTLELVKNSRFVINFASTGISYALLFKKPIFFIYTETQRKKNPGEVKYGEFLHRLVGGKLINIDRYSEKNLSKIDPINVNKYKEFIKNYMSFKTNNKPNYKIISELIKKI